MPAALSSRQRINSSSARSCDVGTRNIGVGRPPTGGETLLWGIRLPTELIVRVDAWAKLNGLSRSEAIRRLVEGALPA